MTTMRFRGCGTTRAISARASASGTPRTRSCIGIASGFQLASRRSPSTPLRPDTTASRPRRLGGAVNSGSRGRSTVSMVLPTARVTPRTLRYTNPVMPRVGSSVARLEMPGGRAMLRCIVSTTSVMSTVSSATRRPAPRTSAIGEGLLINSP
jgi:hypothetical protein